MPLNPSEREVAPPDRPHPPLGELELDFLRAACDLSDRQFELSELLRRELWLSPYQYWIRSRLARDPPAECLKPQYREYEQVIQVGAWRTFFHGLECDVENVEDGRFVRIDFGPGSQPLALSGWGVLQYVMCARPPWRSFPALREFLAERGPPYDSFSGSYDKMVEIWSRLWEAGLLQLADPELAARRESFEVYDPEIKCTVLKVPAEQTELFAIDLTLCDRTILSPLAAATLRAAEEARGLPDGSQNPSPSGS